MAALYIYECNSLIGYTCIDSILNIRIMVNKYCVMLGSTISSMAIIVEDLYTAYFSESKFSIMQVKASHTHIKHVQSHMCVRVYTHTHMLAHARAHTYTQLYTRTHINHNYIYVHIHAYL